MRKARWKVAALSLFAALVVAPGAALAADGVTMYRLYNRWTGEHFYTASTTERSSLIDVGWTDEGTGWTAPTEGAEVYRLYNPYVEGGDHHYTMSAEERDSLVDAGWNYEGVGWHSAPEKDSVPLYRQYNPYATTGTHNYTASKEENDYLVSVGWKAEGVGWYGMRSSTGNPTTPDTGNPTVPDTGDTTTTGIKTAVDFFHYVYKNEGNDHGYIALAVVDVNNVDEDGFERRADWYIQNTGTSMDGNVFADYTTVGSTTDATYIDNVYQALDIIEECNRLRALEGLPELKVSDTAMAIGMLNANWSAAFYQQSGMLGHAANYGQRFNWAENVAMGYSSPEAAFGGWYWQEKADYTQQTQTDTYGNTYTPNAPGSAAYQTGHYKNIINPDYVVTGAGFSRNGGRVVLSQEFKYMNSIPMPGLGGLVDRELSEDLYTVDEYRARLDAAVAANR